MDVVKLLGQVAGVAKDAEGAVNGALNIFRPNGKPDEVAVAADSGHLLVQVKPEAEQRVAAVLSGLNAGGDRAAALQALYPHLPAKALEATLGFADAVTEELERDGNVSVQDMARIGMQVVATVLR